MKKLYTTIITLFLVLSAAAAQTNQDLIASVNFNSSTSGVVIESTNGTTLGLATASPVNAASGSYLQQTGKQTGSNKISYVTLPVNAAGRVGMRLTWYEKGTDVSRTIMYRLGSVGTFTTILVASEIVGTTWVKKTVILPAALDNQSNIELQWQLTVGNGGTAGDKYAMDEITVALWRPVVSASVTSLTFDTSIGVTSPVQNYEVTGSDLTSNVTIGSSDSRFKVSVNGSSYGATAQIVPVDGKITGTTVSVVYEGLQIGNHAGTLTHAATGVTSTVVSLSGATSDIPAGSLPVELSSFTGQTVNGTATLAWTTATETNNDKFVVERSQDGKSFVKVGEVKGNGNSIVKRNYSFTDKAPVNGVSYYRLRQVDLDGTEEFSNVVALEVAASVAATVYPTSATTTVTISLQQATGNTTITVVDATGRPVASFINTADRVIELPVQNLKSGIYFVKVANGQSQQVQRFIKN